MEIVLGHIIIRKSSTRLVRGLIYFLAVRFFVPIWYRLEVTARSTKTVLLTPVQATQMAAPVWFLQIVVTLAQTVTSELAIINTTILINFLLIKDRHLTKSRLDTMCGSQQIASFCPALRLGTTAWSLQAPLSQLNFRLTLSSREIRRESLKNGSDWDVRVSWKLE